MVHHEDEIPRRRASDFGFWERHKTSIRASLSISVSAIGGAVLWLIVTAVNAQRTLSDVVVDSATHARLLEERRAVDTQVAILQAKFDARNDAADKRYTELKKQVDVLDAKLERLEQRMYDRVNRGGA